MIIRRKQAYIQGKRSVNPTPQYTKQHHAIPRAALLCCMVWTITTVTSVINFNNHDGSHATPEPCAIFIPVYLFSHFFQISPPLQHAVSSRMRVRTYGMAYVRYSFAVVLATVPTLPERKATYTPEEDNNRWVSKTCITGITIRAVVAARVLNEPPGGCILHWLLPHDE